ncbi:STAS domain-containing protein [Streptomyces sp. NPDC051211]|uniref:STAS domain-containing protein n=1 Tax=Streptomyces sp. NPDC051211 TaxID=3154643 RepID=UPI00344B0249
MEPDFHVAVRRYGPTLHLAPVGELDIEAEPVFARVRDRLDSHVAVVVCDMQRVSFMDVTGMNCMLALAHYLQVRDTAFFTYNWCRQPQRLLDLVDRIEAAHAPRPAGGRPAATAALRRTLGARAQAGRGQGASGARADRTPVEAAGGRGFLRKARTRG